MKKRDKKVEEGEEKREEKIEEKRVEKREKEEVEEREGLLVMPWWLRMIMQDQVKGRRGLLEE